MREKERVLYANHQSFGRCFGSLGINELEDAPYYFQGEQIFRFNYGQTYQRGDVVGDQELLKKKSARESTVVALEDLHVCYLTRKEFADILEQKQNIKFFKRVEQISAILGSKSQQLKFSLAYLL